jgi:hypothetical protein
MLPAQAQQRPCAALVSSAATQVLMGHPAVAGLPPTLGQHPGQAAWMTLASLFTLAASMSELQLL